MLNYLQRSQVTRGSTINTRRTGETCRSGFADGYITNKIGGDNNVLARTMNFEFLRPVFTGDTIVCEAKIEEYERQEKNRTAITASFSCINQKQKEVLTGEFSGVIL